MPDDRLENLLGALALALTDQLTAAVEEASGLTDAGPAALMSLHESTGGRSVDELRQLVGLTHSGAVRLVDRLVAGGYVERGRGTDGRSVSVGITPAGIAVAERIRAARHLEIGRALGTLDEPARTQLTAACEHMLDIVTRNRIAARRSGETVKGGAVCRLCDFGACGRPNGRCPAESTARDFLNGH